MLRGTIHRTTGVGNHTNPIRLSIFPTFIRHNTADLYTAKNQDLN